MSSYDPDWWRFSGDGEEGQRFASEPFRKAIPGGSVPAWQCECFHWNGVSVDRCNNCGAPKPCMALVKYDARFLVFDWRTVSDAAYESLMATLRKCARETELTIKTVREATETVREIRRDIEAA